MRRPCHIMMMLETTAARPKKMLIMWLCLSGEGRGEMSVEFVVDSELAIGAMIVLYTISFVVRSAMWAKIE